MFFFLIYFLFFWIFEFYFIFLYSRFLLVIYFIHIIVYRSLPIFQFSQPWSHGCFTELFNKNTEPHLSNSQMRCVFANFLGTRGCRFHCVTLFIPGCLKQNPTWSGALWKLHSAFTLSSCGNMVCSCQATNFGWVPLLFVRIGRAPDRKKTRLKI